MPSHMLFVKITDDNLTANLVWVALTPQAIRAGFDCGEYKGGAVSFDVNTKSTN